MNCPTCGYAMSEHDLDCPRCLRMEAEAILAQEAPPPTPAADFPPVYQPPLMPPAAPSKSRYVVVNHTTAWIAGCIPLISIFVSGLLQAMGLTSSWVALVLMLVINGAILEGDRKYLEGLGLDTSSLKSVWIIPAYLFSRPAVAGGGNGYAILWCVLFALSFLF